MSATTSNEQNNISNLTAETFASLLSGPLLEIVVGPEQKRWHLHLNLLRHHSSFFHDKKDDGLLNGTNGTNSTSSDTANNTNGTPNKGLPSEHTFSDEKLDLSTEDPAAFRILVKWLYQGNIEDVSSFPDDKKWDYAYSCQNLYLLCERLSIPTLKNLAIDQFRRGCHQTRLVPGAEEIKPIYERTALKSPFRHLVSRIAARQIMDPDTKRDANVYRELFGQQPDFAVDVLNAIRDGTEGVLLDDPTEGNGCRYHEHENGESCVKSVHFVESEKG